MKTKSAVSKQSHTPGPWEYIESFDDLDGREFCIYELDSQSSGHLGSYQAAKEINKWEAESNARLIAAAPELLAVAKAAERFYVEELEAIGGCDHPVNICCCGIVSELECLRAAIRKAEGQ